MREDNEVEQGCEKHNTAWLPSLGFLRQSQVSSTCGSPAATQLGSPFFVFRSKPILIHMLLTCCHAAPAPAVGDLEELGSSGAAATRSHASRTATGQKLGHVTRIQHTSAPASAGSLADGSGEGPASQSEAQACIEGGAIGIEGGAAGIEGAQPAPPASPQPPPSMRADYAGWVAHQKARWRQQRHDRKRRRLDSEAAARSAAGRPRGGAASEAALASAEAARAAGKGDYLGVLLRRQNKAVMTQPWQLLQLAETSTPGRFKVRV